jgi:hypothetical protein
MPKRKMKANPLKDAFRGAEYTKQETEIVGEWPSQDGFSDLLERRQPGPRFLTSRTSLLSHWSA